MRSNADSSGSHKFSAAVSTFQAISKLISSDNLSLSQLAYRNNVIFLHSHKITHTQRRRHESTICKKRKTKITQLARRWAELFALAKTQTAMRGEYRKQLGSFRGCSRIFYTFFVSFFKFAVNDELNCWPIYSTHFYGGLDIYRASLAQAYVEFTTYFYVNTDTCKTPPSLSHTFYFSLLLHRALDHRCVIQLACVRDYKLTSLFLPARTCSENHLWPRGREIETNKNVHKI